MGVQREPGQGVSWSNIAVGESAHFWRVYLHLRIFQVLQ